MNADPRKILITFNFWDGDREATMRLARFLADIEPEHSERADMLFVCRYDCTQDKETIAYVSKKFNVWSTTSRRREKGWPAGCSGLFFGTADWIYDMHRSKKIPGYKAFLICEADACPLTPDWIDQLHAAWDKANVKVLGPLIVAEGTPLHINGNALYSCDPKFLHRVAREISGCPPHAGYDVFLHKEWVAQGMADCPKMKSFWHHPSMTKPLFDRLVKDGVVFLHGIKDDSVMRLFPR